MMATQKTTITLEELREEYINGKDKAMNDMSLWGPNGPAQPVAKKVE